RRVARAGGHARGRRSRRQGRRAAALLVAAARARSRLAAVGEAGCTGAVLAAGSSARRVGTLVVLVMEPFVRGLREWRLELVEARHMGLEIRYEEVGEVARHAVPDDDPQHGEILAVLGERVCRDEPAVLAETFGHVEHPVGTTPLSA